MPTLQEITLAHSQRLSEIYRTRDIRVAEAQALRDLQLRELSAAAKAYQKYDDEVSVGREKQIATDAKAEAARTSALISAIDTRADRLDDAQVARRSADITAVMMKRRGEDLANTKYEAAIAELHHYPISERPKFAQEAERARREELDQARTAHDTALAASQREYRASIDEALIAERRESRDGERAYLEAIRLGESAARGAKTFADQNLAEALKTIPEARDVLRSWREQLATIAAETRKAEADAFSRFRRELDLLAVDGSLLDTLQHPVERR